MAIKLTPEQREDLTDAIGKLKPSEKSHWTENGYANLDILSKLAGFKVNRDMVQEVAPTLTRKSAVSDGDDDWMTEGGVDAGLTESKAGSLEDAEMPKLPEAPAVEIPKAGITPGAIMGESVPLHDDQVAPGDQKIYDALVKAIAEEDALIAQHRDRIVRSQEEIRRATLRLKDKQAAKNAKFPPISPAELIKRQNARNHADRMARAQQAEKMRQLTGGMSLNPAAPVDSHPPRRAQGK